VLSLRGFVVCFGGALATGWLPCVCRFLGSGLGALDAVVPVALPSESNLGPAQQVNYENNEKDGT